MTQKRLILISVPLMLVLFAFAGSGCTRNCPIDGKWVTGEESGVTSFDVDRCAIPYVYYTVTVDGVQSSGTISLLDTCQIGDDQQFDCEEQGYRVSKYTFSGKFTANNAAEGQLIFNKGSHWDFGDITEDMAFDWKASPSQ